MSGFDWLPDSCERHVEAPEHIAHTTLNCDVTCEETQCTRFCKPNLDDTNCDSSDSELGTTATNGNSAKFGASLGENLAEKCMKKEESSSEMKSKLIGAWNNVKYGWTAKMKTQFKNDSPIWLLGQCYLFRNAEQQSAKCTNTISVFEQFKRDFTSRIWLTYRQDFPALDGTNFTTDVGWGCTLRTGQMVLAQAVVVHLLGRDWRWYGEQTPFQVTKHEQLIRLFGDVPSPISPFSLHVLVRLGKALGKCPPDWYGPASVAHLLRSALDEIQHSNPQLSNFSIYVAQDCTVYKQDILDLSTATGGDAEWHKAILIIIPIRLGGERLNMVYLPCLRDALSHALCVGILGGRPKHSLYFVGWQDDKLLYLDPHFSQPAVDVRQANFPQDSYHCMSPRKMSADKIDPSCALAFYCRTRDDFDLLTHDLQKLTSPPGEHDLYPMFVLDDGRLHEASGGFSDTREQRLRVVHTDRNGRAKDWKTSDDYVLLG